VASGKVTASGVLDARQQPARYQVHKRVQGVDVRPLLQTLAQTDLLEGKGDLEVEVQGSGLSEQALRSRMQGKVNLKLSDGATLYVTASPCIECSKLIIQAGIKRVVYGEKYRIMDGVELLERAGIEIVYLADE
jgi:AsmA protein